MITSEQIERVQDSFARVLPITDVAAADFYARLFDIAPDTRPLFRHSMQDQGRKLFQTLAIVVDALERLYTVLPTAEALAVRHVGYGVHERHYAAVGTALVETLRGALGARFDRETEVAWAAAYTLVSDHMIAAARRHAPRVEAAA